MTKIEHNLTKYLLILLIALVGAFLIIFQQNTKLEIAQQNLIAANDTTRLLRVKAQGDSAVYARNIKQGEIKYNDLLARAQKQTKVREVARVGLRVEQKPQVDTQVVEVPVIAADTLVANFELTDTTKIHGNITTTFYVTEQKAELNTNLKSPPVLIKAAVGCGPRGATITATAGQAQVSIDETNSVSPEVCNAKKDGKVKRLLRWTRDALTGGLIGYLAGRAS